MPKESIDNQPGSTEKMNAVESVPLITGGLAEQNEPVVEAGEENEATGGSERRQIARSASLVMLGNLGSSALGMVRQIVVAALGPAVGGPFNAAILPARTFNDLLVNGSVS